LRGPIHTFAKIKPACISSNRRSELRNNPIELIRNNIFRPTISDRIPAKKLPTEYPINVRRVKLSKSGISRNMTDRTKRPEIQNSRTIKYENSVILLLFLIIIKENI